MFSRSDAKGCLGQVIDPSWSLGGWRGDGLNRASFGVVLYIDLYTPEFPDYYFYLWILYLFYHFWV